ncbi:10685_t:CDS:10 [Paraglomus brasilianum]|uniref:10685_t:CDS:1 n=1 Tax=Paraglomus brasilianum TaxID=144538 RepID=A0A9N9CYJ1_9GLOM|nr:10685_t:CDS:10 [Paraglomus brasilianum]
MAASKESPGGVVVARLNGAWVPQVHTLFAFVAFFSALVVACWTDYRAIVKNQYWGYPQEWFPSVSATTGDRYPARPIFQIFMAINSGPRFLLLYLFYLHSSSNSNGVFPKVHAVVGLLRTLSCGGWVYITSSEDHGTHDIAMVSYLVLTIPWMLGALALSQNPKTGKWRKIVACVFFGSLFPMAHQFYQHKANQIAGAYTKYALFEWGLIIYDVIFDAISLYDFNTLELAVIDVNRQSSRKVVATSSIAEKATDGKTNIEALLKVGDLNNLREFVVDVYLAFVHWSMLTSLAVTIWYFPLWHMGLSGYEVAILVTCTAGLLGIRPVRNAVRSYKGYIQLASLVGIAAYLVKDPVSRLLTVTFGLALNVLVWTSKWVENTDDPGRLERESLVWLLGLILSNVVKMAWWARNPIWPIMHPENGGANGTGLFLAILASIEAIRRHNKTPPPTEKIIRSDKWFASAAGFGTLLFAFHCLLSDTSTITRWVYKGYPDTGPMPVPWGALTIVAMSIGVVLSTSRKFVTGLPWYAVACVACGCMYYFPGWKGYYGGFVLAVYLVSVAPSFIRSVAYSPPGKTFLTAMVIYTILCLANIWTVAYAFVPAGEYLREHTDYVLMMMMGLIGLGVHAAGRSYSFKHAHVNVTRYSRYYTKLFLGVLIVLSTLIMLVRMPRAPVPYHPEDKLLTAGIWTIHFALDNDMWASEVRIRDAIKELELDVIGLLESDLSWTIMGNRDLTQFLGEELDMYADYGPGPSKHTWGCSMLSKFPILRSTHHLLPSPVGELACAIHATLDVYGKEVDVIVSHNGQEEDVLDRELQTKELARIMRESTNPFVFLGYVVTKPLKGNYLILMNGGNVNDIDNTDDDRWCEYVAYRGLKRTGYARVSHGDITDTEIQIGKFQVLDAYDNSTWAASYKRVTEDKVSPGLRFPPQFKGKGVRGHHYHVFDEPRYYD